MKYLQTIIVLAFFSLSISQAAMAEIYKCKNEIGKTSYSDKPCEGDNNETLTIKKTPDIPKNPNEVEIYITSWCGYCKKAMSYLKEKKIPFKKYDIEKSPSAERRKQKLDPNYSGVPLTVINGKLIKGFSAEEFDAELIE